VVSAAMPFSYFQTLVRPGKGHYSETAGFQPSCGL
jgi:hypothetical protein